MVILIGIWISLKKTKTSSALFVLINNESLQGYVYTDSKLTMIVNGNTNKKIYENVVYEEDRTIKDTAKYNANENRRSLIGCLQFCVTEIFGVWQTKIILGACIAACGVTVRMCFGSVILWS